MKPKWMLLLLSLLLMGAVKPMPGDLLSDGHMVDFLDELFASKAQSLLDNQPEDIRHYYAAASTSQAAFQHERKRSDYLHTWAKLRGVVFNDAKTKINILRQLQEGDDVKITLVESLQLTYHYLGEELLAQPFGLGTYHQLKLQKTKGSWMVMSEKYSDPLEEDPNLISTRTEYIAFSKPVLQEAPLSSYNRQQAIAYADKYAGSAWGAGNGQRYNIRYRDYSHIGGDCTNFASQAVGDAIEGGSLAMTQSWFYRKHEGGSIPWIRTDAFKQFLIGHGYGKILAQGSFKQLFAATKLYPQGAIAQLNRGDLIAYEMNGDIDHFCILTGHDSRGYPLVNSHSSDRFHVPMDLGWDKYTNYILIHIS